MQTYNLSELDTETSYEIQYTTDPNIHVNSEDP